MVRQVESRSQRLPVFRWLVFAFAAACGTNQSALVPNGLPNEVSLDFGQVGIGQVFQRTLVIPSTAQQDFHLISVDTSTEGEFAFGAPIGSLFPADGLLSAAVTFAPQSLGAKSATIVLHTDDPTTGTITLSLSGTGVTQSCPFVTPQLLNFGNSVIGTPVTRTVTVNNCSEANVELSESLAQGSNAALFTVQHLQDDLVLTAGAAVSLDMTYTPSAASFEDTAFVTFGIGPDAGALVVDLQGAGLLDCLQINPSPLDFSAVQPGAAETLDLFVKNICAQTQIVSSIDLVHPGSPTAFSLAGDSWGGGALDGGDSGDLRVTFAPTTLAAYNGELDVSSPGGNGVDAVALKGFGGGAAIACAPGSLDFETAAVGSETSLAVTCTNTGTDVPGHPEAGLSISTLTSSNPLFTANVDPASPMQPLAMGQSLQIDVTYRPTEATSDRNVGTLTVGSNVTSAPAPSVVLSGGAIDEQPCHYTITSTSLDFGQISLGRPATEGFAIVNLGPNECLVTGLDIALGSDPVFSLTNGPVVSQRLSPPSPDGGAMPYPTALEVLVGFTPQQANTFTGSVIFAVSNPAAPEQTVSLSGTGAPSCFWLRPSQIHFPTVGTSGGQSCGENEGSFVAVNDCGHDVTVQSVTANDSTNLTLLNPSTLPQTLSDGTASIPFQMRFTPLTAGTWGTGALVQTDLQAVPFGVGITGLAVAGSSQTDVFADANLKVDLLFVLDTAYGNENGPRAAAQLSAFFPPPPFVDYHVGVTTTDVCGGANSEDGRLWPCPSCKDDGGTPTIITPDDPNASADLSQLLDAGAGQYNTAACDGMYEPQFFQAAYEALSGTVFYNQTFVRPDAQHAVLVVTADFSDDGSMQTPQWYAQAFWEIGDPNVAEPCWFNLAAWVARGSAQLGRMATLVGLVGGFAVDMFPTGWATQLNALWPTEQVLALSGQPDPTSIRVFLDGPPPDQTAPGQQAGFEISAAAMIGFNWSYDAASNALDVNLLNLPLSPQDTVYVSYSLICN